MKLNVCNVVVVIGLLAVFSASSEREVTGQRMETIVAGDPCTHVGLRPQVCYHIPGNPPNSCRADIQVGDDGAFGETWTVEITTNTFDTCPIANCMPATGKKIKASNPPCTPVPVPFS